MQQIVRWHEVQPQRQKERGEEVQAKSEQAVLLHRAVSLLTFSFSPPCLPQRQEGGRGRRRQGMPSSKVVKRQRHEAGEAVEALLPAGGYKDEAGSLPSPPPPALSGPPPKEEVKGGEEAAGKRACMCDRQAQIERRAR